jgi:hypothetical protein
MLSQTLQYTQSQGFARQTGSVNKGHRHQTEWPNKMFKRHANCMSVLKMSGFCDMKYSVSFANCLKCRLANMQVHPLEVGEMILGCASITSDGSR